MLIVVEEDGSVGDVQVSKTWGDVNNSAIAEVKKWRFRPQLRTENQLRFRYVKSI